MTENKEPAHGNVRFEHFDVRVSAILGTVLAAAVLAAIIHWAFFHLLELLESAHAESRRSRYPLAVSPNKPVLPGPPRLEQLDRLSAGPSFAAKQLERVRRLHGLGRTDAKGFAHIPIDRAMQLLAATSATEAPVHAADAAVMIGLAGALPGQGGLPTAALLPGNRQVGLILLHRRKNGLVNGGEANSGRLFNSRRPAWLRD